MYTVDYFIDKFSRIPENRWCTGMFTHKNPLGKRTFCAQGFCLPVDVAGNLALAGTQSRAAREAFPEWDALVNLFGFKWTDGDNGFVMIGLINNGSQEILKYFPQTTPKQRVLAALNHLKKYPDSFDSCKEQKKDIVIEYTDAQTIVKEVPILAN